MKKLFKYLKPYKIFAVMAPLMMMLEVGCDLVLPKLMSVIVDCGITKTGIADVSKNKLAADVMYIFHGDGPYDSMMLLVTFGLIMLSFVVMGGIFGIICAYMAARASQGAGNDLRCDAYSKVMSLSLEQTDNFTVGSLVTRMTNDISVIVEFFETVLRMLVRSPMFFIGGTIMLISLNVRFGLVLLCTLPILVAVIAVIMVKSSRMYSEVQYKLDSVNAVVQENVTGARVVKSYVREGYECERFRETNDSLEKTNLKVMYLMAILTPVINIVVNLAIVAVIYIGGFEIQNNPEAGMTTGAVGAAITYITQILSSIMMLTMMFRLITRAGASAKRVNEVLESVPSVENGDKCAEPNGIAVEFRGVGFTYPTSPEHAILRDIDLKIRHGEKFAVIGATGSGKSTLINLIPRFYDATEGEVFIDGMPIKEYDLHKLREKIGFVMQKSELFSDSIAHNIAWGKSEATIEEIKSAAHIAQADEFIEGFPDGYNSMIAEKGASLSGGQKQRISIARAVVRKPEILILDDSTSALDLVTEARLHASLGEEMKETTVIMIAQRIASVMNADRIAVIEEDGRILHCASHSELMKTSKTYREIYNSQIKDGGEQGEFVK